MAHTQDIYKIFEKFCRLLVFESSKNVAFNKYFFRKSDKSIYFVYIKIPNLAKTFI